MAIYLDNRGSLHTMGGHHHPGYTVLPFAGQPSGVSVADAFFCTPRWYKSDLEGRLHLITVNPLTMLHIIDRKTYGNLGYLRKGGSVHR